MLAVLVVVLHGVIREEIVQILEPVVMVLVVQDQAVTVVVDIGVVVVQDFLEMVTRLLELHHLNDQNLSPMDQGVVVVQTVGAAQVGAVGAAVAVPLLLAVAVAVTLAAVLEIGHLN